MIASLAVLTVAHVVLGLALLGAFIGGYVWVAIVMPERRDAKRRAALKQPAEVEQEWPALPAPKTVRDIPVDSMAGQQSSALWANVNAARERAMAASENADRDRAFNDLLGQLVDQLAEPASKRPAPPLHDPPERRRD